MRAAELIVRIGGALGGWLIFLAHGVVIAAIPRADCDPASDELWKGTLLLGLLDGLGIVLLWRGLAWRDSLRWLALAAVPIAAYACWTIAPAIVLTTFGGAPLCGIVAAHPTRPDGFSATTLQRVWPVVQVGVLLAACWVAVRHWHPVPTSASSE